MGLLYKALGISCSPIGLPVLAEAGVCGLGLEFRAWAARFRVGSGFRVSHLLATTYGKVRSNQKVMCGQVQ